MCFAALGSERKVHLYMMRGRILCLHILYSVTAPKSEDNASMKKTDPKEQVVEKKGTVSQ